MKNPSSRRRLVVLLLIGLLIVLLSLAALIYAAWPAGEVIDRVPLSPTLFAPP